MKISDNYYSLKAYVKVCEVFENIHLSHIFIRLMILYVESLRKPYFTIEFWLDI